MAKDEDIGEPSTSKEQCKTDVDTVAAALFAEGKRNLIVGEASQAVDKFQEVCKLLAEKYGEVAFECADAYYHYGTALLDLARVENGVLGNALDGAPINESETEKDKDDNQFENVEAMTEDERKTLSEEVGKALEENAEQLDRLKEEKEKESKDDTEQKEGEASDAKEMEAEEEKKDEEKTEAGKTEKEEAEKTDEAAEDEANQAEEKEDEGDEEGDEETAEDEEEEAKEGEGDATADSSQSEGENPDDVPNLQLSWEMLELARTIYCRKDDKETKLKVAQVYHKLGELGVEQETYEQSINDFNECLKLQQEHLDEDDRLIAETHYNIGLAYNYDKKYEEAVKYFENAVKIIEGKISKLSDALEKTDEKELTEEKKEAINKELSELRDVLPDIRGKIDDAKESKANVQLVQESGDQASVSSAFQETSNGPEKTATSITHLVRKKRKPEDEEPTGGDACKKAKQEDSSDEPSIVNGTNGCVDEPMNETEQGVTAKKLEDVSKPVEDTPAS